MAEYIVKETAYPLTTRQEVVGELIRCKDCKWHLTYHDPKYNVGYELCGNPKMMIGDRMIDMSSADYCSNAEPKEGGAV